jgi:hypothetical protein
MIESNIEENLIEWGKGDTNFTKKEFRYEGNIFPLTHMYVKFIDTHTHIYWGSHLPPGLTPFFQMRHFFIPTVQSTTKSLGIERR